MHDNQLDDLKQFIDSKISQSEQSIKTDMKQEFEAVNQKIDSGFAGAGEAIEQIHNQIDKTNTSVDQRLTKLEQQPA